VNPPRLTLIAVVAAVIAAVYTLDIFLERAESSELHAEARGLYAKGGQLLATGHPADAAEVLQRAFTLDRANRRYQLAYAEALVNAGRRETAAALLADVVRHSPNDGKANLLLARLARTDGDFENEGAYYHRAIYGVWDQSAAAQSSAARLEWIRELVARGDRKQLLSELLPLEAEAQDFNVRKQVAQYLLVAGSPARSADLYRALIAGPPEDASLQKGLG
jgi:thioredoxin-like negative regulator of GroEL